MISWRLSLRSGAIEEARSAAGVVVVAEIHAGLVGELAQAGEDFRMFSGDVLGLADVVGEIVEGEFLHRVADEATAEAHPRRMRRTFPDKFPFPAPQRLQVREGVVMERLVRRCGVRRVTQHLGKIASIQNAVVGQGGTGE